MLHPLMSQRRPTLLIVGCGDVGVRVLKLLQGRWTVWALTSSPGRMPALRAAGAVPLLGNLDDPQTLGRLGGLADRVLHLAPPCLALCRQVLSHPALCRLVLFCQARRCQARRCQARRCQARRW